MSISDVVMFILILWEWFLYVVDININADVLVSDISLICVYGIYIIITGMWLSYTMSYHDYI